MIDRLLRGAFLSCFTTFWILALLFVVNGCTTPTVSNPSPTPCNPTEGAAPDFIGTGLNGSKVQLSALKGKVVLLSFWSSTCSACLDEIPAEKQLFNRYANQPFELIGICKCRVRPSAKLAARIAEVPWLNIWEEHNAIFRLYKVEAVPTFVLVAKDGTIAGRWVGGGQSLTISNAIDKELAK